ncbi:MAG TPA: tubulin-like doman-containing protein [Brevefilum sp.]|nr:tubulin-like doman-containing protein [Brevefilum sp.]HPL70057.1 tubulin-like doman-containing protein [Brevefilum sp.]
MDTVPEQMVRIRFKPTLYIFSGTKAGKVGWRLKKLLYNAYGDIPVLKFLFMDIDRAVDQEQEDLVDNRRERVEMSGYDVAMIRQYLDDHPYIKAWWPEHVNPGGVMGAGAKNQMRLIGRMAFFRRLDDERNGFTLAGKLQDMLNGLRQINSHTRSVNKGDETFEYEVDASTLDVFLVFSPCGGTGSGSAFDLAYLCRHMLEGSNATITSVSMAPSVFLQEIPEANDIQRQKVQANAYAWFKEHNILFETTDWDVGYKAGLRVRNFTNPPFDFSYIIDIENQKNQRLQTLDNVANMMAQALFLSAGTAIDQAHAGFHAIVARRNDRFNGKKRFYSTFATSSLIFPKERLKNYCANKYAAKLIGDSILKKYNFQDDYQTNQDGEEIRPVDIIQTNVTSIRNHIGLEGQNLLGKLMTGSHLQYSFLQNIRKAEDVKTALVQVGNQEDECNAALGTATQKMESKRSTLLKSTTGLIEKEALDCVRQYGLVGAIDILKTLVTSLESIKTELISRGVTDANVEKEVEEYKREIENLKKHDDGPEDVLHRMLSKRHWQKSFRNQKELLIKEMKEQFDIKLLHDAQKHLAKLLDELIADISTNKVVSLENIKTPIENIKKNIEDSLGGLKVRFTSDPAVYELLKEVDVDFDDYYRQFAPKIGEYGDLRILPPSVTTINDFDKWVKKDFENDLIQLSASLFDQNLSQVSLLSILQEQAEKRGVPTQNFISDTIQSLREYCEPFYRYLRDRGMPPPEKTIIIGIEDMHHPDLINIDQAEITLVSTGLRDRIDVVVFQHGLPIHILQGMNACRELYEELLTPQVGRRPDDPLHILPDVNLNSLDIFPDLGAAHRKTFVLGLAFGFIFNRGNTYYLDVKLEYQKRRMKPPIENYIAGSRRGAAVAFSQNEESVKSVEGALEAQKFEMSGDEYKAFVQEKISEWYGKIKKADSEGLKPVFVEERKILEAYLKELQQ